MKCNGCGDEIDVVIGGVYAYSETVPISYVHRDENRDNVRAEHTRTLCPKCHRVMKDILLNSDLSDHWEDDDESE